MHPSLFLLLLAWLPLSCPTFHKATKPKPGTCPVLHGEDNVPGQYCSQDYSCPGNENCCETSDRQQCALPESVLRGYCPKVALRRGNGPTTCITECNNDYDCVGDLPAKKCCRFGRWRLCKEADEEHPGVCPFRPVVQTFVRCKHTCRDDRDCPVWQKCCFTGCGRGCLDSVRSKQCRLPPERGSCNGTFRHHYYDADQGRCLRFIYGGCKGNRNNFKTKEECERTCGRISPEVCKEPAETGPCLAYKPHYYYNSTTSTCKTFVYGGCGGNGNRFQTKLECMFVCGRPGKC